MNIKKHDRKRLELSTRCARWIVKRTRADLPYMAGNCFNESHALSRALTYSGIDNFIEIGEAVLVPGRYAWEKGYYSAAHRSVNLAATQKIDPAWHMWVVLGDGQILDMSAGSWTRDLPENLRIEYIYGPPEKCGLSIDHKWDRYALFDFCKDLGEEEIAYAYKPHSRWMKKKFSAVGLSFGQVYS